MKLSFLQLIAVIYHVSSDMLCCFHVVQQTWKQPENKRWSADTTNICHTVS